MLLILCPLALTLAASVTASIATQYFPQVPNTHEFDAYVENMVKGMGNVTTLLQKDRELARISNAGCGVGNDTSPAVSEDEAYVFSRYAAASYCLLPTVLREWNCRNHCENPATHGTTDVEVHDDLLSGLKFYVAVNHQRKSVIVSFRGSLSPQSLLVDAAVFFADYTDHPEAPEGASVHSGFLAAYNNLAPHVEDLVMPLLRPDYSIDMTGHSMGGSLAVLCALDFHRRIKDANIRVFTYGQPRTGNRVFADFVSTVGIKHITRVTSKSDLIPNMPPKFMGYAHHCGEMHLTSDGRAPPCNRKECRDAHCEDSQCIVRNWWKGNMIHHLKVWDIVFGPWC